MDQLEWIEKTLSESTADYIIVGGHYPVLSIGHHGPTDQLITKLKPLLEKYQVNAYICGHDHNMQASLDILTDPTAYNCLSDTRFSLQCGTSLVLDTLDYTSLQAK